VILWGDDDLPVREPSWRWAFTVAAIAWSVVLLVWWLLR
jgi:hypothetical protein